MERGDTAELCLQPLGPLNDQAGFHLHVAEETRGEENTTEKPGLRDTQPRGPAVCTPPAPSPPSSGPGEPTTSRPLPVILTALRPLHPVPTLLSAPAPEATRFSQDSARRLSPSMDPLLSSPCPCTSPYRDHSLVTSGHSIIRGFLRPTTPRRLTSPTHWLVHVCIPGLPSPTPGHPPGAPSGRRGARPCQLVLVSVVRACTGESADAAGRGPARQPRGHP